jgi:hypothetical protein
MRRSATGFAALLVGAFALAGCGGGNPYSLPNYAGSPGAQPSNAAGAPEEPGGAATSSALPTPPRAVRPPSAAVTYTPADPWGEGAWVERGTIDTHTAAQRAAVTAVTTYMSLRVQLSNTWQVNETALAATASGQALTAAQQRAESQQKLGQRSVGRFVINVSSVRVAGDQATVTGCHFDGTSEVDRNGYVLVPPPGGVLITMNVHLTGGIWRVTSWPDRPVPVCDWRHS